MVKVQEPDELKFYSLGCPKNMTTILFKNKRPEPKLWPLNLNQDLYPAFDPMTWTLLLTHTSKTRTCTLPLTPNLNQDLYPMFDHYSKPEPTDQNPVFSDRLLEIVPVLPSVLKHLLFCRFLFMASGRCSKNARLIKFVTNSMNPHGPAVK